MASNFSRVCKLTSQLQSCATRSEEHTSELQSHVNLVCRLLLEKKISAPPKIRLLSGETSRACVLDHLTEVNYLKACPPQPHGVAVRLVDSALLFVFFLMIGRPPKFNPFPNPPLFR